MFILYFCVGDIADERKQDQLDLYFLDHSLNVYTLLIEALHREHKGSKLSMVVAPPLLSGTS